MPPLPAVGTRLSLSGNIGTVRFVGQVENTPGTWLGVEWDDPNRGKHDGVKDGTRYFSCRVPNSGSFIRPTANGLSYGTSFLKALFSKYVEILHGSESQETVVLGSSQGAITVEAVGLDKIRNKLGNLERLREISLENEHVSSADEPGLTQRTCPNVRGLDLTTSLLPDWETVAAIAVELPLLQRLVLNRNRLALTYNPNNLADAFRGLTDLHLNGTLICWTEIESLLAHMPKIVLLEIGYNHIASLESESAGPRSSTLESINLDGNLCSQWSHISRSVHGYPALARLILTSNLIGHVPPKGESDPKLPGLKHLSLSSNQLQSWDDIDALPDWCPALESLMLIGNPIVEESNFAKYSRQFVVSKIPTLRLFNGTQISSKERTDCELFYLSHIAQNIAEEERSRHKQWDELCRKHGSPDQPTQIHQPDKLGSRLIEVNIFPCVNPPASIHDLPKSESIPLRALPSMTLRSLRQKVSKVLKRNPARANVRLWLKMEDSRLAELDTERDKQTLDWLGLDPGTHIFCWVQDNA